MLRAGLIRKWGGLSYLRFSIVRSQTSQKPALLRKTFDQEACCSKDYDRSRFYSEYLNSKSQNNSDGEKKSHRRYFIPPTFIFAGVFSDLLLNLYPLREPDEDEKEIQHLIKDARKAMDSSKYDEADKLLHEALEKAQAKKCEFAIDNIYDNLSLLYMRKGEYSKAEPTIVELMVRLLKNGTHQGAPIIVELSLRLANIYAERGEIEKAEDGYRFAIDNQSKNMSKWEAEEQAKHASIHQSNIDWNSPYWESKALFGMAMEAYATFLLSQNRIEEAEMYFREALEIAHAIFGSNHRQTVIMMNNYATVCMRKLDFGRAAHYFKQVAAKVPHIPSLAESLPQFYCNYAEALWHSNEEEKALDYARRAVKIAEKQKNSQKILSYCRKFLSDMQNEYDRKKR